MGITGPLRARPFSTGAYGESSVVPHLFPVAIAGRPYMIDTARADEWRHETVPLLRQQSDDSSAPGEASLNPEGLWRRTWSTWHKGTGQTHRDRPESLAARFQESRGVDIWNRYELSLLPAVDQKRTSSNTNLKLMPCNDRLFLTDGASVVYTTDITSGSPTWSDTSNEPGGTILDVASDGRFVWITDGSNIYRATGSASPPDFAGAWSAQDADVLGYVKGRLVSAHDNTLHTYDASGTATPITIAGNLPSTFTFVGFAAGPTNSVIYAAGVAGDKSLVFRIGIREDGTGLDAAIVAGELPDGEIVRSIGSYLGYVFVGTDDGVRFAIPGGNGDLEMGALLETGSPCRCFEGQGKFVWFGWDQFVESSVGTYLTGEDWHGLGRFSLEEFTAVEALAPAYATDMMTANTVGEVSSVVTFNSVRVWTVEGADLGVYAQEATKGTSGYLLTGLTDYGFTGDKTAVEIDIAYSNPANSILGAEIEVDDTGEASTAATVTAESEGVSTFEVGPLRGSRFNTMVALVNTGSVGPTITSFTLKSTPGVESANFIQVPILLSDLVDPNSGVTHVDVDAERNNLRGYWETRAPITYTELSQSHRVTVEDLIWAPRLRDDPVGGWRVHGTMVVKMKEI